MVQQFQLESKPQETDTVEIVKITSPSADGIFPRTRLFKLLDRYQSTPVTWVAAPAGSGKTSLVTSYLAHRKPTFIWYQCDPGDIDIGYFFHYLGLAVQEVEKSETSSLPLLTPEYLQDIYTFSRNYFEKLYLLLHSGAFLIFDNFQEIDPDSLLVELLSKACERIPNGIRTVFISRSHPPQAMARLQLHNQLIQINGDDLFLTPEETRDLVSRHIDGEVSPKVTDVLYVCSRGWMAGVILLINQQKEQRLVSEDVDLARNDVLFDYFACEVFQAEPPDVQNFLISTAFLPEFTEDMAREMSGDNCAKDIIQRLLRHNFFITRHRGSTFQYHPLFRDFLMSRVKVFSDNDRRNTLIRRGADLLVLNGKYEEAANLYAKVNAYRSLIQVICKEALHCIQRGKAQTLQSWIEHIPEHLQAEYPWILYWKGMCQLPFNVGKAKSNFEQAYAVFKKNDDISGVVAAWCEITKSIIHALQDLSELDHWIGVLDKLLAEYRNAIPAHLENQVAACMFSSQALRKPDHANFSFWKDKAIAIISQDTNISLRIFTGFFLLSHSFWIGDLGMADKILQEIKAMADSLNAQPLARVTGHVALSWHGWMAGNDKSGLAAVERGLKLSAETGVVIWNHVMRLQGAAYCLSKGDADGADPWLDKLSENLPQARAFDIFCYHHDRAWQALIRNKPQEAFAHQQSALDNIERCGAKPVIGIAHFGMSLVCHEADKFDQRDHHLAECRLCGERCQSRLHFFMVGLAEAKYALEAGRNERAMELLQQAMAVGRIEGYYNFSFWHAPMVLPLVIFCLKNEIEVEYVQKLILKRNLRPLQPPVHIENWPWPLRIYTFGRFSVLKNGRPLAFGKKASIKVLELFKAIIASGGRDVSEDRLSDYLWPDSDGDAANQALATTLFRLRKWLGVKNAIIRSGKLISLNPYTCWVDAWTVERLLGEGDKCKDRGKNLIWKAAGMYSGLFLAEDVDKPWSTLMRERLRGKMLRAIGAVAEDFTKAHLYKESISCYQKGIEIDPLAEELYQALMKNYAAVGETANALRTYNQLQTVLLTTFDITPSQSSQALYRTLINKKR